MPGRGKGRVGRPYLRACATLRAQHHDCWLCGQPIDYNAPPRTRWSYSTDHVTPLSHDGAPLDPGNLRAAHYGCNSARGNRPHLPTTKGGRGGTPGGRGDQGGGYPTRPRYTSPHW